jgi:branched-chain amino acid aminotransferase
VTGIINLNGALLHETEARIPVLDQGLLYGMGVFITLRAANGRLFRAGAHLDRLRRGAATLGITIPGNDVELHHAMLATLAANGLRDASVRLTVTRGTSAQPLGAPSDGTQSYFVTARPAVEPGPEGATGIIAPIPVLSSDPLRQIKSLNFALNFLAREAAGASGADEAILLNERDEVVEASTANVFIVSGGTLLTPPADAGCLPGITRAVVLELAAANGMPTREERFGTGDLLAAGEAFLTNSGFGVRPLISLDGRPIGGGRRPITEQLAADYEELVRRETTG